MANYPTLYWPTKKKYRITKYAGTRRLFGRIGQHRGYDIATPVGTPVSSIHRKPGNAYVKYQRFGFGHWIYLRHDDGTGSVYAHLSKVNVKNGQRVNFTTQLGLTGKSGRVTGPHLHFEYHKKAQNWGSWTPFYMIPRPKLGKPFTLKEALKAERSDVINADVDLSKWWNDHGFYEYIFGLGMHKRHDVFLEMMKKRPKDHKTWLKQWYIKHGHKEGDYWY